MGRRRNVSAKAGFGSALIDKSIPSATVRREFTAEGLNCTVVLPLPEAVPGEAASTA